MTGIVDEAFAALAAGGANLADIARVLWSAAKNPGDLLGAAMLTAGVLVVVLGGAAALGMSVPMRRWVNLDLGNRHARESAALATFTVNQLGATS